MAQTPKPTPDNPKAPSPEKAEPARGGRRALVLATVAGTCAIGAAAACPALALALAPLGGERGTGRWVRTVEARQLKEGEPKRVPIVDDRRDAWMIERGVELGSVWLVRRGEEVVAFSAVCPHLGCSVNAAARHGAPTGFACPCHTSAFDALGQDAERTFAARPRRPRDAHRGRPRGGRFPPFPYRRSGEGRNVKAIEKLGEFLDERTGYKKLVAHFLDEPIRGGARWAYVFGSALLGTLRRPARDRLALMASYAPSDKTAWASVHFIQFQQAGGWLVRGLHHFGAQAMVIVLGAAPRAGRALRRVQGAARGQLVVRPRPARDRRSASR